MKDIEAGIEITYDYAMVMFRNEKSKHYFKMLCKCGSDNCRRIITEDDWKLPDLQKRYDGYFQPFIQDKIDQMNSMDK